MTLSREIRQAKIQIYEDRAGKWRFNLAVLLDGGKYDIKVQSSDDYPTEKDAEAMARLILTQKWDVVDDDDMAPKAKPAKSREWIAWLLLGIVSVLVGAVMLTTFTGCVSIPKVSPDGQSILFQDGQPVTESVPIWAARRAIDRILIAKQFRIPDEKPAGDSWVEDAGKAAGLFLLAAGIIFAIARDPVKGILGALGGAGIYLATVFLSEIASAIGDWVRVWVPWVMTGCLVAALAAVVYAGWRYRSLITALIRGHEAQKELRHSEPGTEDLVKKEQGAMQPWISKIRKASGVLKTTTEQSIVQEHKE